MPHAPFAAETLHHEQRNGCTISNGHDAPRSAVSMHHPLRRIHTSSNATRALRPQKAANRKILAARKRNESSIEIGQKAVQGVRSKVAEFVIDSIGGWDTGVAIVQELPSCRISLLIGTFVMHLQSPQTTSP